MREKFLLAVAVTFSLNLFLSFNESSSIATNNAKSHSLTNSSISENLVSLRRNLFDVSLSLND
jgi:hypothetical protein